MKKKTRITNQRRIQGQSYKCDGVSLSMKIACVPLLSLSSMYFPNSVMVGFEVLLVSPIARIVYEINVTFHGKIGTMQ